MLVRRGSTAPSAIALDDVTDRLERHFARQMVRLLLPQMPPALEPDSNSQWTERFRLSGARAEIDTTLRDLSSLLGRDGHAVHGIRGDEFPQNLGTRRILFTTELESNGAVRPFPHALREDLSLCQQAFDEMHHLDHRPQTSQSPCARDSLANNAATMSVPILPDVEYMHSSVRLSLYKAALPRVVTDAQYTDRVRARRGGPDIHKPAGSRSQMTLATGERIDVVAQPLRARPHMYIQPAQRMVSIGKGTPPHNNRFTVHERLYDEVDYSTDFMDIRGRQKRTPKVMSFKASTLTVAALSRDAMSGKFEHASDSLALALLKHGIQGLTREEGGKLLALIVEDSLADMVRDSGAKVEVQNALCATTGAETYPVVVTAKHTFPIRPRPSNPSLLENLGITSLAVVYSYGMPLKNFKEGMGTDGVVVSVVPSFMVTVMQSSGMMMSASPLRHPRARPIDKYMEMTEEEMEETHPHSILIRGDRGTTLHSKSRSMTVMAYLTDQWTMLTDNQSDGSEGQSDGALTWLMKKSGMLDNGLVSRASRGMRITSAYMAATAENRIPIVKGGVEFPDVSLLESKTLQRTDAAGNTTTTSSYKVLYDLFFKFLKLGAPREGVTPVMLTNAAYSFWLKLMSINAGVTVQEANVIRTFGMAPSLNEFSNIPGIAHARPADYVVRLVASWFMRLGYASTDAATGGTFELGSFHLPTSQRHLGAMYRFTLPYSVTSRGIAIWTVLPSDAAMLIDRGALKGVFVGDKKESVVDLTKTMDALIYRTDEVATGNSVCVGCVYAPLVDITSNPSNDVSGYIDGKLLSFKAIINDACALILTLQTFNAGYFIWHPQFSILIVHNRDAAAFYACVGLISRPSRFVKSHRHAEESLVSHHALGRVPIQQILPNAMGRLGSHTTY